MTRPVELGAAIREVLASLGLPDPEVHLRLEAEWAELAGPPWSDHARPLYLRRGELVVEATSPMAMSLLRYSVASLEQRLRERLGEGVVQRVVLRRPS